MSRHLTNLLSLVAILAICACQQPDTGSQDTSDDMTQYDSESAASQVVKIDGDLFSIPSPMQTAIFIKKNGSGFHPEYLLDPNNLDAYQSGSEKAVALGIYGAELGYVSLHEENDQAITFMNASRKLADDIGLSGAFSEDLVKRFSDNIGEPDSMAVLVADIYEAGDAYLKGNERNDIACLVLFGGWLESLHFTTIEADSGSEKLKKRLAEQKTGLERLVLMMNKYSDNSTVADILPSLNELYDSFSEVSSKYVYKRPEVISAEQLTVLKGTVEHQMSEEIMADIVSKTNALRNSITGLK